MPTPPATTIHSDPPRIAVAVGALVIVAATFAVYWPAMNGGFLWDDDAWTVNLSKYLRNGSGLLQMWLNPVALQQYYPLTGTTFWMDHYFWGENTFPYHVENVSLHALSALLLWRLLFRLGLPCAWLIAAVFAVHPAMVESAAWITERKNVLSLALGLCAVLAYLRFDRDDGVQSWKWYMAALLLFVAALLSKITVFATPPVLLLLVWWKRGVIEWRKDVLPLLPLFAVSVLLGAGIAWIEKHHVGAVGADWDRTLAQRLVHCGHAWWFYVGHVFWPSGTCFVYPLWNLSASSVREWLPLALMVAVHAAAWLLRRRLGIGPLVALLIFSGTAFPILGLMNVYGMRYAPVADHWMYLPAIPIIALAVAALHRLCGRYTLIIGCVLLPVMAQHSWRLAHTYADMETLWLSVLKRNPDSWLANNNYGTYLLHHDRIDEAMTKLQKAIALRPDYAWTLVNIGNVHLRRGEVDEAMKLYSKAVELHPEFAEPYNNMGGIFFQQGLADDAEKCFTQALAIQPDNADAFNNLGNIRLQKGDATGAMTFYSKAIESSPDSVMALYNLAWIRAASANDALRDGTQAVHMAERAKVLTAGKDPSILQGLAAAFAEVGRFDEAVRTAEDASRIAAQRGDASLAQQAAAQTELYRSGKPLRDETIK